MNSKEWSRLEKTSPFVLFIISIGLLGYSSYKADTWDNRFLYDHHAAIQAIEDQNKDSNFETIQPYTKEVFNFIRQSVFNIRFFSPTTHQRCTSFVIKNDLDNLYLATSKHCVDFSTDYKRIDIWHSLPNDTIASYYQFDIKTHPDENVDLAIIRFPLSSMSGYRYPVLPWTDNYLSYHDLLLYVGYQDGHHPDPYRQVLYTNVLDTTVDKTRYYSHLPSSQGMAAFPGSSGGPVILIEPHFPHAVKAVGMITAIQNPGSSKDDPPINYITPLDLQPILDSFDQ